MPSEGGDGSGVGIGRGCAMVVLSSLVVVVLRGSGVDKIVVTTYLQFT